NPGGGAGTDRGDGNEDVALEDLMGGANVEIRRSARGRSTAWRVSPHATPASPRRVLRRASSRCPRPRSGSTPPGSCGGAARARARRRLGAALAIVDAAWPEAGEEIRLRTRLVLPLDEPGLVSFSLVSRPGVSFINLRGKSTLDLADDLLHETAHHRLHAIEE